MKRHHIEFGLFGVANNPGYVFYHNSDCVLLLFVFFVWIKNIIYIFI